MASQNGPQKLMLLNCVPGPCRWSRISHRHSTSSPCPQPSSPCNWPRHPWAWGCRNVGAWSVVDINFYFLSSLKTATVSWAIILWNTWSWHWPCHTVLDRTMGSTRSIPHQLVLKHRFTQVSLRFQRQRKCSVFDKGCQEFQSLGLSPLKQPKKFSQKKLNFENFGWTLLMAT